MSGLLAIGEQLYVADGPMARDFGIPWDTRMIVAVLGDGSVWVESPVLAAHETLAEIAALGPVRYALASTPRHVWRLGPWHTLFPEAELWACRRTVATLKPDALLPLRTLTGEAEPSWAADFDQVAVKGSFAIEEICYLHKPSGTLIVGDLIEVLSPRPGKRLHNVLLRFGGQAAPDGGTARDIRASFLNRAALRASLERVLDWDFDQVVVGHGPIITTDARGFVARAFAWAFRRSA
ncbi:MAG TPA: DUF4336 domain-containing protein [Arachnia sp.]|nr:DUF4336 domain-containing protein [Arachnia sp.]